MLFALSHHGRYEHSRPSRGPLSIIRKYTVQLFGLLDQVPLLDTGNHPDRGSICVLPVYSPTQPFILDSEAPVANRSSAIPKGIHRSLLVKH